jgi:hypothetical protein
MFGILADPFNGANKVYRQPPIAIPQGTVDFPTAPHRLQFLDVCGGVLLPDDGK